MARREKWHMISLLLAEALRSRRGIFRVGPVPHATRILCGLAAVVNVPRGASSEEELEKVSVSDEVGGGCLTGGCPSGQLWGVHEQAAGLVRPTMRESGTEAVTPTVPQDLCSSRPAHAPSLGAMGVGKPGRQQ